MTTGLIGYTGFVGSNLISQHNFEYKYNRQNIQQAAGKKFNLIVCAAPSAIKWKANLEPEWDWKIVQHLMENLKEIQTDLFIHISTVDIYPVPINVYEDTKVNPEELAPYGRHRFVLEQFIQGHFTSHLIIRLPALFGTGLKKNFIYDLMNNNSLNLTHKDSQFQFFFINRLWDIISIAMKNKLQILNVSTPPIRAGEISFNIFNHEFSNITQKPPAVYNMKSRYDLLFQGTEGYLFDKDATYADLMSFINKEKNLK